MLESAISTDRLYKSSQRKKKVVKEKDSNIQTMDCDNADCLAHKKFCALGNFYLAKQIYTFISINTYIYRHINICVYILIGIYIDIDITGVLRKARQWFSALSEYITLLRKCCPCKKAE